MNIREKIDQIRKDYDLTIHDFLRTIGLDCSSRNIRHVIGTFKYRNTFSSHVEQFNESTHPIVRGNVTKEILSSYFWDNTILLRENGIQSLYLDDDVLVICRNRTHPNLDILEELFEKIGERKIIQTVNIGVEINTS